jgi:hypothetical protein
MYPTYLHKTTTLKPPPDPALPGFLVSEDLYLSFVDTPGLTDETSVTQLRDSTELVAKNCFSFSSLKTSWANEIRFDCLTALDLERLFPKRAVRTSPITGLYLKGNRAIALTMLETARRSIKNSEKWSTEMYVSEETSINLTQYLSDNDILAAMFHMALGPNTNSLVDLAVTCMFNCPQLVPRRL